MELGRRSSRGRTVASGVAPFLLLVALVAYVFGPGSELLDLGVPLPEISLEKIDFAGSEIVVTVRNTGPVPVEVVMADVNDRIQPAAVEPDRFLGRYEAGTVRIPFEWNEAEPYVIGLTIQDGTRFEREVKAAAPALEPSPELFGFFAIIGTYVGVIPVAIGLLWLPFIRRISRAKYHFFLALTAGLLLFLGIDSVEEALAVSGENLAGSFNGVLLVATVIVLAFLGLYYSGDRLARAADPRLGGPFAVALMIAVGIGLHNFGEGLAIGAAVGMGSMAFSSFLIVGFAIHNTTEGIAIAAPLSREKAVLGRLAALGMIAGGPAILGAWTGGFAFSPLASVVFLSVGAGAIFQVILVIMRMIRAEGDRNLSSAPVAAGVAVGMLVMYVTSIAV